jgi:hypothetical protein
LNLRSLFRIVHVDDLAAGRGFECEDGLGERRIDLGLAERDLDSALARRELDAELCRYALAVDGGYSPNVARSNT